MLKMEREQINRLNGVAAIEMPRPPPAVAAPTPPPANDEALAKITAHLAETVKTITAERAKPRMLEAEVHRDEQGRISRVTVRVIG